ncbi:MAG: hypothetical protein NC222_06715 [Staphylococcus sp.]|nr:hypothetical protein [Staphylococcus sp.]
MLDFLFKKKDKTEVKEEIKTINEKQKCYCIPVISNKEDLIDGEKYSILIKMKLGKNIYYYIEINIWDKKFDCFKSDISSQLYKFEDVIVFNYQYHKNAFILDYNPSKLNVLDIQNLYEICVTTCNENTQSDEIWEKLLSYFDKRGIL